jgi:hypothetical protein
MNNSGFRTRNIFQAGSQEPFKLSRSKLELFIECPRCFYLDRKLGVSRPASFPFTLNNAVDALLKKEFDIHRVKNQTHPMMATYGIDAVPFAHPEMDKWRHNFTGIQYLDKEKNLLIYGAIDDVWVNSAGELMIVDYKATATESEITLDAEYRQGYKRQMEIYQWLFRKNDFKVSNTGYFVYANGKKDRQAFDGRLDFDVQIIPYQGDDSWVSETIIDAHQCLINKKIPLASQNCNYCVYRQSAQVVEK